MVESWFRFGFHRLRSGVVFGEFQNASGVHRASHALLRACFDFLGRFDPRFCGHPGEGRSRRRRYQVSGARGRGDYTKIQLKFLPCLVCGVDSGPVIDLFLAVVGLGLLGTISILFWAYRNAKLESQDVASLPLEKEGVLRE